ncbi:MAG: choice-of-anchor H family protein [Pseudomonadota bacterium]
MTSWISKIAIVSVALGVVGHASANDTPAPLTSVTQGLVSSKSDETAPKETALDSAVVAGKGGINTDKPPRAQTESVNQDFWIFDASAFIRDDFDGDGFYTRIELTFDADTVYTGANVYAVLYLSLEGGDWVEYGETDVFEIYGQSGNDSYFYDTDLISGFPPGYYDVLIELYDDFDNRLVADFGPADTNELFDLPLESVGSDSPGTPIVVVSNEGGGGAGGLLTLIGLLTLVGVRRFRQRLDVANELAIKTD